MKVCCFKAELHNELCCFRAVKGLDYIYSKGKIGVADLRVLSDNIVFQHQRARLFVFERQIQFDNGNASMINLIHGMYKIYHGDIAEGVAPNAKMILEGTGNFAALYNVEMIVITDPTSTNLDTSGHGKTLKTKLSRSNVPLWLRESRSQFES
jgi:hypothetical protein